MLTVSELWGIQEPLLAMAALLELAIKTSSGYSKWKSLTYAWWCNLQLIKWPDRYDINKRFLEIFHIIYGDKFLSCKRFFISSISSFIFVLFSYWLILIIYSVIYNASFLEAEMNIDNREHFFYYFLNHVPKVKTFSFHNIAGLLWDSIGINLLPDIISLLETEWILKKATEKESNLLKLFLLDFILTSLIWLIAHSMAILLSMIYFNESINLTKWFFLDYRFNINNEFFYTKKLLEPKALSYICSTYSTSLLWALFLIAVLFLSSLKRASNIAVNILETKWVAKLPIGFSVGFLCLISWIIYFFYRLILLII